MLKNTLQAPFSHYLLNAESSKNIDHRTIEEMEINSFTLMEVAGSSAARSILRQDLSDITHGVYLCGKGNNAGDALVVARYLLQHCISGSIVFLSGIDDLSEDTRKNMELLKKFDAQDKIQIFEKWGDFESTSTYDFIIDGMLGTGLDSPLRDDYEKAVDWANEQPKPVFSMDIPTGLHADSGQIMGSAIHAYQTFAFGALKQGFYLADGPSTTGNVHYCELPFPNRFKSDCSTFLLDEQWIHTDRPKLGKHKYDSGVLYIIAGSEGLTGAAIMAAKSAWAEGLGAVILICPRAVLPIYEQTLPSIIKKAVGKRDDFFFKEEHTKDILELIQEKAGSVLLGPGLGRADETVTFVQKFLSQNVSNIVIDADGLWCLAQQPNWQKPDQSNWILTPHPGELKKLIPENTQIYSKEDRLNLVRPFAAKKKVTILSKGMPGIIATPSANCYLTNYDTRYFARAGSGDVLAGKTSAYFALDHAADQSCAMALMNGKKKLESYLTKFAQKLPEPKDFI